MLSRMAGTPLDGESFINVESFKRDGGGVKTPVWAAALDGKLVFFTLVESFKVKRLARNPKVRVAACDVRGNVRGDWYDGEAVLVTDTAQEARAYAALRAKYGWQMKIGDVMSGITGRKKRRRVFEITLAT